MILVALVASAIQACTHATPAVPQQQPLAAMLAASSGLKVVSKSAWAPTGTEHLVVHSERVGRDFTVVIALPPGDFASVYVQRGHGGEFWEPEPSFVPFIMELCRCWMLDAR